jgi:uncharacterized membrane protein YbhN (UPF0104 family)
VRSEHHDTPRAPAGRADLVDRIRGRHLLLGVAAAIAVVAAVVIGLGRVAGYARLSDAFSDADPAWLALCVVGQAAVFAGYAGATREAVAADGGPRVPATAALRLIFASFAATQLLAFGGIGGLAIIYWALRRVGMPQTEAAVRLIGLNTAVYLVFGVVGWCGALASLLLAEAPLGLTIPWLAAIPLVLLVARWFSEPARVARWDPDRNAGWRRALGTGIGATGWVRRRLTAPDGRPLFAWSACYWIGDLVSLWAALHAVGGRLAPPALVLAYATGYIAQSLPIPFIATGGVDAATTFVLHLLGVPLDVALAGVLAHRAFAFWIPVIPGSIFALTLPRLGRHLAPEEDDEVAPARPGSVSQRGAQ